MSAAKSRSHIFSSLDAIYFLLIVVALTWAFSNDSTSANNFFNYLLEITNIYQISNNKNLQNDALLQTPWISNWNKYGVFGCVIVMFYVFYS